MDIFFFALFAFIAVICAINVVVQTHPIASALSLIGVMASLAVLYLLLGGEFIAMAQIIVYAGAVMVLFVFIIALMNPVSDVTLGPARGGEWIYGIVFGVIFAALLGVLLVNQGLTGRSGPFTPEVINTVGNVQSVGTALYTKFLFPVEVTSVLLLIAAVGAVYLAVRRIR